MKEIPRTVMKRAPHFIRQPEASRKCGQTCVAILSGRPIDDICKLMGKSGGTRYQDMRKVLPGLGINIGKVQLYRRSPILRDYALIRMRFLGSDGKKYYHWLLYWEGALLDPAGIDNNPQNYGPNATFLSFAELTFTS